MHHVMIVDDDPLQLSMFKAMLEASYEITTYADPRLALAKIEETKPNLVLVDLALPYIDGFTFFKKVRESEHSKDIPIIAISAQLSSNTAYDCDTLGFSDLISKPVTGKELRAKLAEHFNRN